MFIGDLRSIKGVNEKFKHKLSIIIYNKVRDRLKNYKKDFISIFIVSLLKEDMTAEETQELTRNVEELFNLYMDNIVLDNGILHVRSVLHEKTGLTTTQAASMYEYGTSSIPPRVVWRNIELDKDVAEVILEARVQLDKVISA
jgi:hypothetical protein